MEYVDPTLPPLDGSISVLPGFIDFHAEKKPDRTLYIYPYPDLSSDTLRSTTYAEFAHATHRIAHALRPNQVGSDGSVVGVIANVDQVLYHAILVGLIRAGWTPFAMSPRNSPSAIASMMERTGCHHIVSQPAFSNLLSGVRSSLPPDYAVRVDDAPTLASAFPSLAPALDHAFEDFTPYPSAAVPPLQTSVAFYLHSSGTTGHPKPIPQTHEFLLNWCRFPLILFGRTHSLSWGAHALPPFHTMAIVAQLLAPIVSGCPTGLFPPRATEDDPLVVPSPQNTILNVKRTKCDILATVPFFLEIWAHSEEDIETMASLKLLLFAGGPLSKVNGDKLISRGVRLSAGYGATESGSIMKMPFGNPNVENSDVKAPEDWEWIMMPDECKVRWDDQGDGTYELQLLNCATHKPAVENLVLPDGERGYATSDLWVPHPTKPGLWRIVGRKDDVIVLGTGEKVVPVALEAHVGAHPAVSGVVAFGRGHAQAGILVEARLGNEVNSSDQDAVARFRNAIWPRVEEANRDAPAFARIFKEMILLADPKRPLPRAAKGTVQRKKALELYARDIETLYQTVADATSAHNIPPPRSWGANDMQEWLLQHVQSMHRGNFVDPQRDLFEQGFDSLGATVLRNRIIGALRSSSNGSMYDAARHIPQNLVYQQQTIISLATSVSDLVCKGHSALPELSGEIGSMVERYTALLPASPLPLDSMAHRDQVILLTGTTGNLGVHVLALFLQDHRTTRVYALNRGGELLERHEKKFEAALIPLKLLDNPKLVLLSADFPDPTFHLPKDVTEEIRKTVTHVVHMAWRVDFNIPLLSFEATIAAAVNLLALVPTANYLFTSSISAAVGIDGQYRARVPEAALHDHRVAARTGGYGMSKYVVEEVLSNARQRGFRTTSVRMGQISGASSTGMWNTSEWIPMIVNLDNASSLTGIVRQPVSWIPMDAAARMVVELAQSSGLPEVVNVVHPRPARWTELFTAMQAELGTAIPFVPFKEWVQQLEIVAEGASQDDLDTIPGIKLLEYLRSLAFLDSTTSKSGVGGFPIFDTINARTHSKTLSLLPPLNEHDSRRWVKYWKSIGFM